TSVSAYGGTPWYLRTAPGPALYAAAARVRLPWKSFSNWARYCAPPRMFCAALKASATPMSLAVSGINCIRPCAPAWDSALGLKALSAWMTARRNAGLTPYRVAATRTALPYDFRSSGTVAQLIDECTLQAAQRSM